MAFRGLFVLRTLHDGTDSIKNSVDDTVDVPYKVAPCGAIVTHLGCAGCMSKDRARVRCRTVGVIQPLPYSLKGQATRRATIQNWHIPNYGRPWSKEDGNSR